eukprot:TRINITY_DN710_c1_g4_i2.p1 TRINITY_DN710_c1_g4~~TRINITY_DN710_c1_g4_i2.p1  ORF type:complete len:285 (+),score=33.88 TRINITY_DN710_c1_g4_i2:256-1110(+)
MSIKKEFIIVESPASCHLAEFWSQAYFSLWWHTNAVMSMFDHAATSQYDFGASVKHDTPISSMSRVDSCIVGADANSSDKPRETIASGVKVVATDTHQCSGAAVWPRSKEVAISNSFDVLATSDDVDECDVAGAITKGHSNSAYATDIGLRRRCTSAVSDDFETALSEHLAILRASEPHAVGSTSSSLLPRQASLQGCPSGTMSYHKPCNEISDEDGQCDLCNSLGTCFCRQSRISLCRTCAEVEMLRSGAAPGEFMWLLETSLRCARLGESDVDDEGSHASDD